MEARRSGGGGVGGGEVKRKGEVGGREGRMGGKGHAERRRMRKFFYN